MNIVIADAHSICREALVNFIRHADQEIEVRGVGDYAGLMSELSYTSPDIVLLDPSLPGLPFMGNYSDIDVPNAGLRIGLMVNAGESYDVPQEGISGIFPKTLSSKNFLQGIYKLFAGEEFIVDEDSVLKYASVQDNAPRKSPDDFHLTQREKQVMTFLVQGATNKDIARALDLQVVTVKLHVRGICRKMGAKNRTQAALIAKENGWDL